MECSSDLDSKMFENLPIFDEVEAIKIRRTKKCARFWATLYKVNVLTRNIIQYVTPPPMKILLDCCIPAKFKELKPPKIRTAEKLQLN